MVNFFSFSWWQVCVLQKAGLLFNRVYLFSECLQVGVPCLCLLSLKNNTDFLFTVILNSQFSLLALRATYANQSREFFVWVWDWKVSIGYRNTKLVSWETSLNRCYLSLTRLFSTTYRATMLHRVAWLCIHTLRVLPKLDNLEYRCQFAQEDISTCNAALLRNDLQNILLLFLGLNVKATKTCLWCVARLP